MDDRKKILVVDDSRVLLKALSTKLACYGYQVLTAEDGGQAIRLVRQERLHLILLDISFPPDVAHGGGVAWDGFLIMDWLRRMDEGKEVPIVIMTGGDPAKLREKCFAAGAVAYVQKPVEVDELLAVVHHVLREKVAQE